MNRSEVGKLAHAKTTVKRPPAVRTGRPSRERLGEVETRILDAAHRVFLERGLAGASVDEIAGLARAGKPTIYSRFPNKEALFVAAVKRELVTLIGHIEADIPQEGSIESRVHKIGLAVVHWALFGGAIGLMRLAISEAQRFPDLGSTVQRMARERGTEAMVRLLGEAARSNELGAPPAFAPDRIGNTTRIFLDLVLLPLLLRALFGERPTALQPEIEPHVKQRVAFFFAACKSGF